MEILYFSWYREEC